MVKLLMEEADGMIYRRHYRGCIKAGDMDEVKTKKMLSDCITEDGQVVKKMIEHKNCLTVALYRYRDMLFLYYEALEEKMTPQQLFPKLSEQLELWPEKDGRTPWAYMYNIFYHAVPENEKLWTRQGKKIRRGRIAYLQPDKVFSYTYWHKALVDEGLLEGDQYQSIALHENILFSYFEEPKKITHIKQTEQGESKVIRGWLAADPESHFDHDLSGKDNFLLIDPVFTLGTDELQK